MHGSDIAPRSLARCRHQGAPHAAALGGSVRTDPQTCTWPCHGPLSPRTFGRSVQVRPYLMADGGNVEFVEIDGPVVYLRLAGACGSCPSSLTTMTMGIKRRLMERIPVSRLPASRGRSHPQRSGRAAVAACRIRASSCCGVQPAGRTRPRLVPHRQLQLHAVRRHACTCWFGRSLLGAKLHVMPAAQARLAGRP